MMNQKKIGFGDGEGNQMGGKRERKRKENIAFGSTKS